MKAIVTGMIATYPLGGVAWDYGQYALGLERLGFEVYYLEDAGMCMYSPTVGENEDMSEGAAFVKDTLSGLSPGLSERWHIRQIDGQTFGLSTEEITDVAAEADLFLNVSSSCLLRDEYLSCRRKVLIDTDPGWNHFFVFPLWEDGWGPGTHGYRSHDHYFTYSERIGRPGCVIPDLGLQWYPTRPPVVLDRWTPGGISPGDRWTTVTSWDEGQVWDHDGVSYGTKAHGMNQLLELPKQTSAKLEIAMGGHLPPVERFRLAGWRVVDALNVSDTADAYRSYIQGSRGELSPAREVYVATRSGWFSCRSVCYLAAGRPAVLQDTGFSEVVPTGEGLFAFSTLADAAESLASVENDYDRHSRAARELAETFFSSDMVLVDLLERVGL